MNSDRRSGFALDQNLLPYPVGEPRNRKERRAELHKQLKRATAAKLKARRKRAA